MSLFGFGKDRDGEAPPAQTIPEPEATSRAVNPSSGRQGEAGPYNDSREHLWHALAWADQLIRAQTIRWRKTVACHEEEKFWGMVHVTESEVDHYLHSDFMPANQLPRHLVEALQPHLQRAQQIAGHIEQRLVQTPDDIELRLLQLERRFSLCAEEVAALLICLLPELDSRYRRLFGYLQDDASRNRPGVELLLQILQPIMADTASARALFNGTAPLRRHRLLSFDDPAADDGPLSEQALHVDARIADYLLGGNRIDSRLGGLITLERPSLDFAALWLEADRIERLQAMAGWLRTQLSADKPLPVFLLHGRYGTGRQDAAMALSQALGLPLLQVDTRRARQENWVRRVELILREARLQGAAVYWQDSAILRQRNEPREQWEALVAALARHPGLVFLASDSPWDPAAELPAREFIRLDFAIPGFPLRKRIWNHFLPAEADFETGTASRDSMITVLANGFQLTAGQIRDAVATAHSVAMQRAPDSVRYRLEDFFEGCRRQSSRNLVEFARLIEPRADLDFDDLVLPRPNKRQLDELRERIRYRSQVYTGLGFARRLSLGRGLIALFTGASGTGKTMAAELLGREYGMQIYKVDLAAVVSKYVGETEKNLARVFDEAEDANAILFFDEGEALFGKRGEVKDARDRWANSEVNYLLQRIEEYRGVVIITTNFRQNMDSAFLRRIHASVDFPRPDAEARYRILLGMFPPGIERPGDEELRTLAEQFTLSGGNIKNVVIDAAFRAVAEAGDQTVRITQRHLVLAIAREEQKMGRALTRGDFGEPFHSWVEEAIL